MPHSILIVGGDIAPVAREQAEKQGFSVSSCKPYPSDDELAEAVAAIGAEALIVRMGRINERVLALMPSVRIVVKHGVGFDTIDIHAAAARKVPVLIAGGANALSVAEHALALLMSVARSTAWLDRRIREGHWEKATYAGIEITGRSLGLVGLGAIGRSLMDLLVPFRMPVRVYDPYLTDSQLPPGAERVQSLKALLGSSDVVSLHCPLTDENRHLIDADSLAAMKPGAILINTARGGLVDQAALAVALRQGIIRGAGLDTFEQEPPARDDPLWSLPNVVASPHVGANTEEARARVGVSCVDQIAAFLDHGSIDPANHVNAPGRLAA